MLKNILLISASLTLCACQTGGIPYDSYILPAISKGDSQIIVYRPSGDYMRLRSPSVEVNGVSRCNLKGGSFFSVEMPPQQVLISASLWDMPGTSRQSIIAKKGQRAFVKIAVNSDKQWSGALGGLIGMGIAEGMSSRSGPFIIEQVSTEQAQADLQNVVNAQDCR